MWASTTPGSLSGRPSPSGRVHSPCRAMSPSLYSTTLRLTVQETGAESPSLVVFGLAALLEEEVVLPVLLVSSLCPVGLMGDRRRSAAHASLIT